MPSKCYFAMKLVGSLKNLTAFQALLQADSNTRIGTGITIDAINQTSVNSLILHGNGEKNPWKSLFVNAVLTPPTEGQTVLNILEASQMYDVQIEFFTNETVDDQLAIMEHYLIADGCLKEHQLVPAFLYNIRPFASKEEAQKACNTIITDEEWNARNDFLIRRGGLQWTFRI